MKPYAFMTANEKEALNEQIRRSPEFADYKRELLDRLLGMLGAGFLLGFIFQEVLSLILGALS